MFDSKSNDSTNSEDTVSTLMNIKNHFREKYSWLELFVGLRYVDCHFDEKKFIEEAEYAQQKLLSDENIIATLETPQKNVSQLDFKQEILTLKDVDFFLYLLKFQNEMNTTKPKFIEKTGLEPKNILEFSISSTTERNGYMLILDEKIQSLCLYLNGTQGIIDAISDLKADPVPISETLDGYVHEGMLHNAQWFVQNKKKKIKQILNENPNFHFLIVGHSLGAGVGSILSILLKKDFPDLKCIGFATPSCISQELLEESAGYITTFVNNNDFVPCFSVSSVKSMKTRLPKDWQKLFKQDIQKNEKPWVKTLNKYGITDFLVLGMSDMEQEDPMIELEPKKLEKLGNSIQKQIIVLLPAGRVFHFRNIEKEIYVKPCSNQEFEELKFLGEYIEDHFLEGYLQGMNLLKVKFQKFQKDIQLGNVHFYHPKLKEEIELAPWKDES
jgi:hypothetical protein